MIFDCSKIQFRENQNSFTLNASDIFPDGRKWRKVHVSRKVERNSFEIEPRVRSFREQNGVSWFRCIRK